ncbi:hypothetical protein [Sphingomonas sp. LM7]|uniref:hypothetical protein n=1 Tax=Sphingomonas sp. LM7 TaxID=1938607 RepID=UPI00098397DE|nr:hypothetical protein [Sphingomonas sp. LM7]AQR74258.1 hypothetical protein BXU08_11890 [Sphingomonas sp. LM7]
MANHIRHASLALAAAMLAAPCIAQAQQSRTIDVPAGKKWQHAATGLIVPQALAGMPRTAITDATTGEIDVSVQFGDPQTLHLTLYIFRPAVQAVPMWFDRIETHVLGRDAFGDSVPHGAPIAFAPPHATAAGALRRVYVPGKGPFKATGAALLPLGEWLVALRLSSTQLDPAALDAKLVEAVAGLGWPAPATAAAQAPAAAPIAPCTTALNFSKKAKPKKPDMTMALFGAALASAARNPEVEKAAGPGPSGFCREGAPGKMATAYRALAGGEGYLIALGDAGRTISVYPELKLDGGSPGYAVTLQDLATSYVFPAFDKLPAPDKVVAMLGKTRPISSSARGDKTLTINVR